MSLCAFAPEAGGLGRAAAGHQAGRHQVDHDLRADREISRSRAGRRWNTRPEGLNGLVRLLPCRGGRACGTTAGRLPGTYRHPTPRQGGREGPDHLGRERRLDRSPGPPAHEPMRQKKGTCRRSRRAASPLSRTQRGAGHLGRGPRPRCRTPGARTSPSGDRNGRHSPTAVGGADSPNGPRSRGPAACRVRWRGPWPAGGSGRRVCPVRRRRGCRPYGPTPRAARRSRGWSGPGPAVA